MTMDSDSWDYPLFVNLIENTEKARAEVIRLKGLANGLDITDGGFRDEISALTNAVSDISCVGNNTRIMLRASKQYDEYVIDLDGGRQ